MKTEDWKKGLDAWESVKKQAEIDMEQANLYIKAIKEKIESIDSEANNGK